VWREQVPCTREGPLEELKCFVSFIHAFSKEENLAYAVQRNKERWIKRVAILVRVE